LACPAAGTNIPSGQVIEVLPEEWERIVPVFCGGITVFFNSPVHLTCNGKYFLDPDFSKGGAFSLSGLFSLNG